MPLMDVTNNIPDGKKTIEETYQKKTQLEHILLRPDTYIGSVERDTEKLWVMNEETTKMEQKNLSYVPGLYKIFDEILVNAADNKQRDPSMNMIQVEINQEENKISVWNNGKGIPVQIHQEHGIYVPELIFGHLLTSSNYDDNEKKTTGGRNGFGAKLTNIFSTEFTIKTYDSASGKMFKKTWTDSMRTSAKASIESVKATDFTQITFKPDLSKFGMDRLEDDIVTMMKKRVWDIAGCTDKTVKVKLNGVTLPVSDFKDYVNLYPIGEAIKNQQFDSQGRWTICVTTSNSGFKHCSFVNSIWTFKGGKHVEYITNQVVEKISEKLKKKADLRPQLIKQHLWVFINCLIENPAFDSQTKETLTTVKTKFGSECKLSDKLLEAVCKGDLMMRIIEAHNNKAESQLNKNAKGRRSNRVTGIAKLEEANEAGGPRSQDCTLVLTEGDSAKTLAISGFSIVGRDYWGVFPLRGKLLNVRDAAGSVILKNQEIQNIMKILRLQVGEKYTDTSKLRYGHLMIMADQDHDGSHIKGLLINFIHHFWPELLSACPGFLVQFITPIVKVTMKETILSFYSLPDFRKWQETNPNSKEWSAKYYKGLGTSTSAEAKQYFKQLARHKIVFDYRGDEDKEAILLAFDKNRIEDRKAWVTTYCEEILDFKRTNVTISDFVNKELVLFSRADCERSIPSVIDGFKPSQRKILFSAFKKPGTAKRELKVPQLAGYTSEQSAYHHGEASLHSTIIGMAQDYCGSNNVNLLEPIGQFGTRLAGGKDASQPRYLFTKLSPMARALFPADDDALLTYKEDDGLSVEPVWYVPIIPMVLCNGSKGIGTGYATSIPNYNPEVLVEWIRCKLQGNALPELHPWYRDFTKNTAITQEGKSYRCVGTIREVGMNGTVVNITELPIEKWTEDYKNFLEELLKEEIIHDFREHHTDVTVDFEVQMDPETLQEWRAVGLEDKFKLRSSIPVSNLVCFDHKGSIAKYDTVKDIFEEFFQVRYEFYRKRKSLLIDRMQRECERLKNMVRFILQVINKELNVMKRKKVDLLAELKEKGYKAFPPEAKKTVAKGAKDYDELQEEEEQEQEEEGTGGNADYNYLLNMAIWSLTHERFEKLKKQLAQKEEEFNRLYQIDPKDMWLSDLDHFLKVYNQVETKRRHALTHSKKDSDSEPIKKGKKGNTNRLEFSHVIPKRSETAKKLAEEHAAKQAQQEAAAKRKEERDLKRLLKGDNGERAPKRRKAAAANGAADEVDPVEPASPTSATNDEVVGAPFISNISSGTISSGTSKPILSMFTKKSKPKPKPSAAMTMDIDGISEMNSPSVTSMPPPPPPPPKPKAKRAAPAPKKASKSKSKAGSDDPDASDFESAGGSDDDFVEITRPQRATRERKPVKYTEENESFIEDSDVEEDDDSDCIEEVKAQPKRNPAAKKRLKKLGGSDDDDDDESFHFD